MAKSTDIRLVVITPERQVLEERTESVVIPAHDGELGVLRGRAPLMCELGIGQLRYVSSGKTRRVLIDGGFAQVHDNQVTVLTAHAVRDDEASSDSIVAEEAKLAGLTANDPDTLAARDHSRRRLGVLRSLRS